jgi:autotransporter-associated beta strand protein
MPPFSWARWLRSLFTPRVKTQRRQKPGRRLALEHLETRLAPATFNWTGAGPDANWSTGANWLGGVAPSGSSASLDDLVFGPGAVSFTTTNDLTGATFNSIAISASNYSLGGNALTLGTTQATGSGNIVENAGFSGDTIALNVQLAGAAATRQFITVNFGATLTITGKLIGTTGSELTKEGSGTLVLGGDNSGFTGPFTIDHDAGIVTMMTATALGTGQVTVGTNSQLQISGVSNPITNVLIVNGPGIANNGALLEVSGTTVWAGNVTLDSDVTLGASAGAQLSITGQVSDRGAGHNLTKEGAGIVYLDPLGEVAGNTYRGTTTVNAGILEVGHPFALGAGGAMTTVNTSISESGTLALVYTPDPQLQIAPQYLNKDSTGNVTGFIIPNEFLTLNGVGLEGEGQAPRDLTTRRVPTANIVTTTGALTSLAGYNSWEQTVNFWTNTNQMRTPGNFYEPAVCIGAAMGATMVVDGVIQDPADPAPLGQFKYSFSKVGKGRVVLTAANTFTADIDILDGALNIRDSKSLGSNAGLGKEAWWGASLELQADGILDSSTGTYNLDLPTSNYIWLDGPGFNDPVIGPEGALRNIAGINKIEGGISLQSSATIDVEPDPDPTNAKGLVWNDFSQLTANGVIDSAGLPNDLTKAGTGELVLTNANVYRGQTFITQGWVTIRNNGALGQFIRGRGETAQERTTVSEGAALVLTSDLLGNPITLDRPLTISGIGFQSSKSWYNLKGAIESLGAGNSIVSNIVLTGTMNNPGAGIGVELDGSQATPPVSTLLLTGQFSESAPGSGLTKLGSQRLTMLGSGTYSGPVDIRAGVLRIQNNTALGNGTSTTTVETGTALEIEHTVPALDGGIQAGLAIWGEHLILNGTGNSAFGDLPLTIMDSDNMWHGPITLNGSTTFSIPQNSRFLVYGPIDDAGNTAVAGSDITLTGGGELTLYGIDTYRGVTYVNQGVLTVANSQALGAPGTDQLETLTLAGMTAGTSQFTLTFNGGSATAPITYTGTAADATAIQTALKGLATIGGLAGTATVTQNGSVFTIDFGGSLTGFNQVPGLAATVTTGPGTATVNNVQLGTGGTVIANGAALELQGSVTVAGESLMVQGAGDSTAPSVPLQWFNVGPAPVTGGQTAGSGNVSGRVTGVAYDPSDSNVIYISTAGGGAWKTMDGGKSWLPLFDGNPSVMFGGAIAVAPSDPRVIYYGSGEEDNSADSFYGSGVWKSTDSGQTWTQLGGATNPLVGQAISRIAVDPGNPNLVYVTSSDIATSSVPKGAPGVWRFAGTTWFDMTSFVSTNRKSATGTKVPPPGTPGPDDDFRIKFPAQGASWSDLQLIGGVLYAAMGTSLGTNELGGTVNAVYRCANPASAAPIWFIGDGAVDSETSGEFPSLLTDGTRKGNGNIKFTVVQHVNASGVTITDIYAVISHDGFNPLGDFSLYEIRKSTDGGVTWGTTVNPTINYLSNQGDYDSTIVGFYNGTDDTLYVGGVEQALSGTGEVLTTTNGGGAWTDISIDSKGNGPHTDEHGMALDANHNLLLGGDGGMWQYIGGNWVDINGNLNTITFNDVDLNPTDPTQAIGGSQDNGAEIFNNNQAWTWVDFGDGGQAFYDPKNPTIVYHVHNGGLYKSTQGGVAGSWNLLVQATFSGLYPPFTVDTVDDQRLMLGGSTLQESHDQGATWTNLQPPSTGFDFNTLALATYQGPFAADPAFPTVTDQGANSYDPNTFYVSDNLRFLVTKDHGNNWVDRTKGLGAQFIQQIVVDPRNSDHVFVVDSSAPGGGHGRVFETTDSGMTWRNITTNLPDIPTWCITIDPRGGTLYVGTDQGVYYSLNDGVSWAPFGTGLANVQVTSLKLSQNFNILAAASYGRGMWLFYLSDAPASSGALRAASGSAVWTGAVDMTGNTTVAANGVQTVQNGISVASLNILGPINDMSATHNAKLTKIGQGDVILSGTSTYSGATEVVEGNLVVHNPLALGGSSSGVTVDSGAALELESNLNLTPITLSGDGISFNGHNTGALHNLSNNNTYTGTLTLNTNSTIGVESGGTLTITSPGTITDGVKTQSLTKELPGTLILASADTYHGSTFVSQGALEITNAASLGVGGTGTQVLVLDGAQLQLAGGITVQNQNLNLSGTGIFGTGAIESLGGINHWAGPVTLARNPGVAPITNPPFFVAFGALATGSSDALFIDGLISEKVAGMGLNKVGAGTVILNNTNSYSGTTTVAAGTLRLQNGGALGTSGKALVNAGAELDLDGDPNHLATSITVSGTTVTLNGSGVAPGNAGALRNLSGLNTWAGNVVLQSNSAIGADANTELTISGVIQDPTPPPTPPATLTKVGAGIVDLLNDNTYAGLTTVAQGTLLADAPSGKTIGAVSLSGGTLGGRGTVGTVTAAAAGGTVIAGDGGSTVGTLTTASETWNHATNFYVALDGAGSGQFSTLSVNGTLALGTATLEGFVDPSVGIGSQFVIITATGGITGKFAEPYGAGLAYIGGAEFSVDYSNPTEVVVTRLKASTTVNLVSSSNPSVFGAAVTFTATAVPSGAGGGTPTGTISFILDNTPQGAVTLNGSAQASFTATGLGLGAHTVTATYNGDNFFAASPTANLTQTVLAGTTSTLTSSANPSSFNQVVTFTDTVVGLSPGTGTPTGTVTFSVDGTAQTPAVTLSNTGVATFSSGTLSQGQHTITAAYSGDSNFFVSSASLTQTVFFVSNITLSSNVATPVFGQPVTITANVSAVAPSSGTPTGMVTFSIDGVQQLPAVSLNSNDQATFVATGLSVGSHNITANYAGDSAFAPTSTPRPLVQKVKQAASSSVVFEQGSTTTLFSQAATFIVTVSPVSPGAGTPTGQVEFIVDGSAQSPVMLNGFSQAGLTTSSLSIGKHTIGAMYLGDTNFTGSTMNPPLVTTVNAIPTATTMLDFGPSPTAFGQLAIFIATVSAPSGLGTPTGTLQFVVDSVAQPAVSLNSFGQAGLDIATLPIGIHTIGAIYNGSGGFAGSSSAAPVVHTVGQIKTTTNLFPFGPSPTVFGQLATVFMQVVPSSPTTATPTGFMQFIVDNVAQPVEPLNSFGMAGLYVSNLAVGQHAILAAYGGDAHFTSSSTPTPLIIAVNPSPTLVTPSAPPSASFDQSVTLSANVSATGGGVGVPGGTLTYTVSGAGPLTVSLDSSGNAPPVTFPAHSLAVGSHSVTMAYSGNTNFAANSVTTTLNILNSSATSISASPTQASFGQPITFTASVIGAGGGSPTGTVTFVVDNISQSPVGLNGSDQAALTLSTLPVGSHSVSAIYNGDANFVASISQTPATVSVSADGTSTTMLDFGPSPTTFGQQAIFIATVNNTSVPGLTPTGTLQFVVDGVVQPAVPLNGNGQAGLDTAGLPAGTHTIGAIFDGGPNLIGSTAATPLSHMVNKANTTTVVFPFGSTSGIFGQLSTFYMQASPIAPGGGIPTGPMQFVVDGVKQPLQNLNSFGMAGLYTSSLSVGTHSIGAIYYGDGNNGGSTANPISYTVNASNNAARLVGAVNGPVFTNTPFSVTVVAQDAQGNTATGFNQPAVLSVASAPPGGFLSGNPNGTFSGGSLTLSNLVVNVTGTYTINITAGGLVVTLTFTTTGRQT